MFARPKVDDGPMGGANVRQLGFRNGVGAGVVLMLAALAPLRLRWDADRSTCRDRWRSGLHPGFLAQRRPPDLLGSGGEGLGAAWPVRHLVRRDRGARPPRADPVRRQRI